MAIIPQISLFQWEQDIEILGDLERLQLVLENLPDEGLVRLLEKERGQGRNDYPIRAMWNSLLAGLVYQHPSTASLIRELQRNVQLRYICGFTSYERVPNAHNYSRFLAQMLRHQDEMDRIFQGLVEELSRELPGFGTRLAIDSKYVSSLARRKSQRENADGRSEQDADLGMKSYHGVHQDGTPWEKVVKCFGFKLHLVVDAEYELPVAFQVTKASASDAVEGHKLLDKLLDEQKEIVETCQYLSADKGYDDTKLITKLRSEPFGIKPVIDTRQMWKGEKERPLPGYKDVYYNEQGEVHCYDPKLRTKHLMSCDGYEARRDCLRKQCPVKAYGICCPGYGSCPNQGGVRIPLTTDKRIFNAVDRSSYKFRREYRHRTAVERVNSRLDNSLGFERHTIRGMKKMTFRLSLALILMLAMALGRVRQNRTELMRSLVKTA